MIPASSAASQEPGTGAGGLFSHFGDSARLQFGFIVWAGLAALTSGVLLLVTPWALAGIAVGLTVSGAVWMLARWASVDWPGAGLLLFLVVMTAFGRDFAYLHLPLGELPLYVTEICLALLCPVALWRVLRGRLAVARGSRSAMVYIGLYLLVGFARLPQDLSRHGLEALRDAVLVYYALFGLLALVLLPTWRTLRSAFFLIWIGSLLACLLICWNAFSGQGVETSTAGVARYGAGIQALSTTFALLGGLSLLLTGLIERMRWAIGLLLLGQLLVAVFLVQHRSLLLATLVGLVALLVLHPERRRLRTVGFGAYVILAILFLGLLTGLVRAPQDPFLRATAARAGTSIDPLADTNTHWRMTINLELLQSSLEHPLLGAGFGESISIRYGIVEYIDVDPHNSFVAIIYRMGLPAALCLLMGILLLVRQTIVAIRRGPALTGALLSACLASFAAVVVFACFNVVLEGPYMGVFFWVLLGILMRFSSSEMPSPRLS